MSNNKFEITALAHETYPFLHRIRALRDIGDEVKTGDLGGFVEHEGNLSFEPRDEAWIFNDAISAGNACVDKDSQLRDNAVVCDSACVSRGSVISGHARVEDSAYVRNAVIRDHARASGSSMILEAAESHNLSPVLSGSSCVYGKIQGNIHVSGNALVFSSEEYRNDSRDMFLLDERGRSVLRDPSRDRLTPKFPPDEQVRTTAGKAARSARKRREPGR